MNHHEAAYAFLVLAYAAHRASIALRELGLYLSGAGREEEARNEHG